MQKNYRIGCLKSSDDSKFSMVLLFAAEKDLLMERHATPSL